MKNVLLLLPVLSIVAFAACKKSSSSPANTAYVMFVHGCAAGATPINLDGKANYTIVPGAGNMPFLKNSGYQPVTAGTSVGLSFFVTGLDTLTSAIESLTANNHYTAFAGGSITAPVFVFTSDNISAPSSGMAKVRFVNLSSDNLNMSCYVGLTKVDSNVAYRACTPFTEIAPVTAKIAMIDQVVLSNSGQITSQQIAAGKIYTFMLTGTATGSGTSVLTLTVINNN